MTFSICINRGTSKNDLEFSRRDKFQITSSFTKIEVNVVMGLKIMLHYKTLAKKKVRIISIFIKSTFSLFSPLSRTWMTWMIMLLFHCSLR